MDGRRNDVSNILEVIASLSELADADTLYSHVSLPLATRRKGYPS
jgi:hypothetical protein